MDINKKTTILLAILMIFLVLGCRKVEAAMCDTYGLCIEGSTSTQTISCTSGSEQSGICVQGVANPSQGNSCGNGVWDGQWQTIGGEQCDPPQDSACHNQCIPAGNVNECKCAVAVASVTIIGNSTTLSKNETDLITAEINPLNASYANINWVSSNPLVAIVENINGLNASVIAVGKGVTDISVTVTNYNGSTRNAHYTLNVIAPSITTFSADKASIGRGESVVLTWNVQNVTSCTASSTPTGEWTGSKDISSGNHTQSVTPLNTTIYNLQCTDGFSDVIASATVNVSVPVEGVTLTEHNLTLNEGELHSFIAVVSPEDATEKGLTWVSSKPSVVSVDSNGIITAATGLSADDTAIITVTTVGTDASGNHKTDSAQITVSAELLAPTVTVWATGTLGSTNYDSRPDRHLNVPQGTHVVLNWSLEHADSCTQYYGSGDNNFGIPISPSQDGSIQFDANDAENSWFLQIDCSGPGGEASDFVIVDTGNRVFTSLKGKKTLTADAPSAGPITVNWHESVTLSWTSEGTPTTGHPCTGTASVQASGGWSGEHTYRGFANINQMEQNTTFSLTCWNGMFSFTSSVTVIVLPPCPHGNEDCPIPAYSGCNNGWCVPTPPNPPNPIPGTIIVNWSNPASYNPVNNPKVYFCGMKIVIEGSIYSASCQNGAFPFPINFDIETTPGNWTRLGTINQQYTGSVPVEFPATQFTLPDNIPSGLTHIRLSYDNTLQWCYKKGGCWTQRYNEEQIRPLMVSIPRTSCTNTCQPIYPVQDDTLNHDSGVNLKVMPIVCNTLNASCGTANKFYPADSTGFGTDTFCALGNPHPVYPLFPTTVGVPTTWTCEGESGGVSANCSASLLAQQAPPSAGNLQLDPNYCYYSQQTDFVNFSWTYNPPAGTNYGQSGFDFQVDNNSDFSSPEVNRSYCGTISTDQHVDIIDTPVSSLHQYCRGQIFDTFDALSYNTTYHWRVKVYDSQGSASVWYYGGTTTTSPGASFATAPHAWPWVRFAPLLSSVPLVEGHAIVSFNDSSVCYDAGNHPLQCSAMGSITYNWDFGDGSAESHDKGNTFHDYVQPNTYSPMLEVCNNDNCCHAGQSVEIGNAYVVPEWREISPF